jgi:hypothetical protein
MRRALFAVVPLALAGCGYDEFPDSEHMATRDLVLSVNVTELGPSPVTARLTLTNNVTGPLRLSEADTLTLTLAGKSLPLREVETETTLDYTAQADTFVPSFTLDFVRVDNESARGLVVPVPPPFEPKIEGLSMGPPLTLTWEPGPASFTQSINIKGYCIPPFALTLPGDAATATITEADLRGNMPPLPGPATCPLKITMLRSSVISTSLLPVVAGGSFLATAQQTRTLDLDWMP